MFGRGGHGRGLPGRPSILPPPPPEAVRGVGCVGVGSGEAGRGGGAGVRRARGRRSPGCEATAVRTRRRGLFRVGRGGMGCPCGTGASSTVRRRRGRSTGRGGRGSAWRRRSATRARKRPGRWAGMLHGGGRKRQRPRAGLSLPLRCTRSRGVSDRRGVRPPPRACSRSDAPRGERTGRAGRFAPRALTRPCGAWRAWSGGPARIFFARWRPGRRSPPPPASFPSLPSSAAWRTAVSR